MGNSIRTCVSGGDVIESTSIEKCSSVSYHDCKQENFSCISSEVPFKPEASPQESEEFPPREPISSDANQEIIEALDQIFILCESGIDSTIAYIRNLHPDVDLVINDTRSYMINGAQVDMTPLQISAACGQVKVISQLLDCPHIMVNQIDPLFHMTALHMAVYYGHTLATEVLLKDIRVLINEKNIDGKTPLHLAVENQHNNIIEVMIRVRPQVDLRLKDFDGNNVLHMAAYHPNKEIMRTLLNHLSLVNFYRDYFDIADITMPNKFKNKNQLLQSINYNGQSVVNILTNTINIMRSRRMVSNETVTTDEQQHSTPDSPLSEELCGASLPYPQSQIDGDDEFLQTVESCLYMVISHIKETSAQDTSMSSFGERSVHTNNDSSNRNSLNSVRSTGSQSLDEKMDDHCIESFPAAGSRLDPVIFIDNEVKDPSSDTSFEQKGACSWSPRNEILYNHCTHRINLVGEED